ncbi:hypothetical protein V494_07930, partial [Pseudogymnoascus sp. VKM F-4513 (FW-928)]
CPHFARPATETKSLHRFKTTSPASPQLSSPHNTNKPRKTIDIEHRAIDTNNSHASIPSADKQLDARRSPPINPSIMASNPYHEGQRGPNVAEFIANLNAIPTAQDLAAQSQQDFNFDDDLAMFTNATFFDFDIGQDADLQPAALGFDGQQQRGGDAQLQNTSDMAKANMDFLQGEATATEECERCPPRAIRCSVQACCAAEQGRDPDSWADFSS